MFNIFVDSLEDGLKAIFQSFIATVMLGEVISRTAADMTDIKCILCFY